MIKLGIIKIMRGSRTDHSSKRKWKFLRGTQRKESDFFWVHCFINLDFWTFSWSRQPHNHSKGICVDRTCEWLMNQCLLPKQAGLWTTGTHSEDTGSQRLVKRSLRWNVTVLNVTLQDPLLNFNLVGGGLTETVKTCGPAKRPRCQTQDYPFQPHLPWS